MIWCVDWSRTLWWTGCNELIIVPDADRCGAQHALRVAAVSFKVRDELCAPAVTQSADTNDWPDAFRDDPAVGPLRVKLLRLVGLPPGTDIVDWLDQGHSAADLKRMIEFTPLDAWQRGGRASRTEAWARTCSCSQAPREAKGCLLMATAATHLPCKRSRSRYVRPTTELRYSTGSVRGL